MKGVCVFLLVVCAGVVQIRAREVSRLGQNSIIEEIDKKANEVKEILNNVGTKISKGKNEASESFLKPFEDKGTKKEKDIYESFEKSGAVALKEAIIKGKPISAIDCVVKVTIEGRTQIANINKNYQKTLSELRNKKIAEYDYADLMSKLIIAGLGEALKDKKEQLKNDKLTDTEKEKIKKEALKLCENAKSQSNELNKRVMNMISLESDCTTAQTNMEKAFDTLLQDLLKKLQKCVS